ncbi:MAG: hypothetical protein HQM02_11675 [Magnetococcales bacterium]|nr:hypothetical protein [Magnetococcales bacterium]
MADGITVAEKVEAKLNRMRYFRKIHGILGYGGWQFGRSGGLFPFSSRLELACAS